MRSRHRPYCWWAPWVPHRRSHRMTRFSSATRRRTSSALSCRSSRAWSTVGRPRAGRSQTITSNGDANLQIEQIRDYLALGRGRHRERARGQRRRLRRGRRGPGRRRPLLHHRPRAQWLRHQHDRAERQLPGRPAVGSGHGRPADREVRRAHGHVLEITGNMGQNVAQLRGGGFHDIVDQYPRTSRSSPRSATGMPRRASTSCVTSPPPRSSTASTCTPTACTRPGTLQVPGRARTARHARRGRPHLS